MESGVSLKAQRQQARGGSTKSGGEGRKGIITRKALSTPSDRGHGGETKKGKGKIPQAEEVRGKRTVRNNGEVLRGSAIGRAHKEKRDDAE